MPDRDDLAARVREAEVGAISEALALVEDTRAARRKEQRKLLASLERTTPEHHRVAGLTGSPGVGKSSLAGALLRSWIRAGAGVGVIAVDPSSRRSGGALLGDRARLRVEPGDRAFVRSMAARDRLGGLAPATRAAVVVLRAAYAWTIVETVGVGQSELDVSTLADSVALVLQPSAGDALQFMKAGILEIPDVLVVHKWDLGEPAVRTADDLRATLELLPRETDWRPPLVRASAHSGEGVEELRETLERHAGHLAASGELARRRARAREAWVLELLIERFGSLGLERLGGLDAVRKRIAGSPGTALDVAHDLAASTGLERD